MHVPGFPVRSIFPPDQHINFFCTTDKEPLSRIGKKTQVIDHMPERPHQTTTSGILTRKKTQQLLEEEDKNDEIEEELERQPRKAGRKPARKKKEAANKEKQLGIQTTIETSKGTGISTP